MIDRDLFLLDPDIVFLNHGSFGAAPRPVFDVYQAWQERLERQPVLFLARELSALQLRARQALGEFIGADADDLVYVPHSPRGIISIFDRIGRPLEYLNSGNPPLNAPIDMGISISGDSLYVLEMPGDGSTRLNLWSKKIDQLPTASGGASTSQQ